MSDWYPVFYDPVDNVCANEAVYPLYSMVMIYYGMCVVGIFLIRVPLVCLLGRRVDAEKKQGFGYTNYFGLWVLPFLLAFHFVFAGLLCKCFQ